jgi:predicted O-methyltransferase YrrM
MNRWEIVHDLIVENNFKVIAEIGIYYGETTKYVLSKLGNQLTKYYLIDIAFRGDIKEFAKNTPAEIMEMTSKEASIIIPDGSLDFVFIDANHEYECILEDIKLWTPKVRSGGIVSGHDYCSLHPGVVKAVSEIFKEFNLEPDTEHAECKNNIWWLRKS